MRRPRPTAQQHAPPAGPPAALPGADRDHRLQSAARRLQSLPAPRVPPGHPATSTCLKPSAQVQNGHRASARLNEHSKCTARLLFGQTSHMTLRDLARFPQSNTGYMCATTTALISSNLHIAIQRRRSKLQGGLMSSTAAALVHAQRLTSKPAVCTTARTCPSC
jgi:hypothetical protein